ncbi:MAG: hypothetical protein E3J72_19620 [Planctomycetota bacterium]|nr:MAG: hypothetical protein E3J72_19620 [Planctomycetota bacterium]
MSLSARMHKLFLSACGFIIVIMSACIAAAGQKSPADRYQGALDEKPNHILVEMLAYPEYAGKASGELARRGEKAVLDLIMAAKLKDESVRYYAISVLDRIPGRESDAALVAALLDDEAPVRARAAFALAGRRNPVHAAALVDALKKETDELARGAIAIALSEQPSPEAPESLLDTFAETGDFTVLAALYRHSATAVEKLEKILESSDDPLVRRRAALALGAFGGKSSVAALASAATKDNEDNPVRFAAILALAAIGEKNTLATALKDESAPVPDSLRKAFESLDKAREEIDKAFSDGDKKTVESLKKKLLGSPPSRALVPTISAYLTSKHPESRKAAAEILGRWGYPECAAALAAALNGPGPIDREAVIIALGRTGQADVVPLLAHETVSEDKKIRIAAIYALSYTPVRMARDILARLAGDPDRVVSGMAISCLSAFPDRRLTPIFRRALKHSNPLTRFSAVTWFGTYRPKPESTALVARIDRETDANVNVAIIRAVSRWKGQTDPVLLGRYLAPKHPRKVHAAAAEALGKYKSQAAAHALLRAFKAAAGKPEQAVVFLEPLGKTGDKIGLALLVKLLSKPAWQNPALKKQVVRALGHLSAQAASARIAKLLTPGTDEAVLIAVAEALGRIGGPAAGAELVSFVRKKEFPQSARRAALEGIVKSGNREGLVLVRTCLSDPKYLTAAAKALGEPETVLPHLIRHLKGDAMAAEKIDCIDILAELEDPAVNAALGISLQDADESVRLAGAAALIRRGSVTPLGKLDILKASRLGGTISKLEGIARFEVIRRIVKALDSPDVTVRNAARLVLARLAAPGSDSFVPPPSDDLSPGEEKERIKAWKTWFTRNKPRLTPMGE